MHKKVHQIVFLARRDTAAGRLHKKLTQYSKAIGGRVGDYLIFPFIAWSSYCWSRIFVLIAKWLVVICIWRHFWRHVFIKSLKSLSTSMGDRCEGKYILYTNLCLPWWEIGVPYRRIRVWILKYNFLQLCTTVYRFFRSASLFLLKNMMYCHRTI